MRRPDSGPRSEEGLRRILENLASNALKYSTPDTPITISLKPTATHVTLTVHNRGPKIPPQELAVTFQQYRRAKTSEDKSGWGLGLAVVEGLVKAHQGKIAVESHIEQGTTFIVELPLNASATA